jgi:hypothetical protein
MVHFREAALAHAPVSLCQEGRVLSLLPTCNGGFISPVQASGSCGVMLVPIGVSDRRIGL